MKTRNILFGLGAGFAAGYAAYRGYEALSIRAAIEPAGSRTSTRYGRVRRAMMVCGIVRSLGSAAAIAYGPFAEPLEASVRRLPHWLRAPVFTLTATLVDTAVNAGVDYVEGYMIERRYGLSEQSLQSWLSDKVKEQAVGSAVLALMTAGFAWIVRRYPQSWSLVGSIATLPLLVAANVVIPVFIMPLFNTYAPLEGPLEERLRALARRYGVGEADILRVDMSKQTKKANAFVTGIGKTHRIVVGDTLLEHFTDDEIEFVVAHELGHYVSGDTWRMIVAGEIVASIVLMGAFELLEDNSLESAQRPVTLARIVFWSSLLAQVMQPLIAAFSRSREWSADHFALQATGTPAIGASAFRRLQEQNLAEDQQPLWYELLFATHPSLRRRIGVLERATPRAVSHASTSR